jgi:hypothetical protein
MAVHHYPVSRLDRGQHTADSRDGASLSADTVHDTCIEFDHSVRIGCRSFAGDVEAGAFHQLDQRNDNLHGALTREKLVPAVGDQLAHMSFLLTIVECRVCPRATLDDDGIGHERCLISKLPERFDLFPQWRDRNPDKSVVVSSGTPGQSPYSRPSKPLENGRRNYAMSAFST